MCRESLPELACFLAARERLRGVARVTPLLPSCLDPAVWIKAENLQTTGSFKIRPAHNQIARLDQQSKMCGIITSSSGNFAQAAALAGSRQGVSVKVVMTRSAQSIKVKRTQAWGAEVVFCGDSLADRYQQVRSIREREGRREIHPFDHPDAVAGNGTVALEILDQHPAVRNVVVPVSGGGLIAGIASVFRLLRPQVRVWGVQPRGSNAACLSFEKGERVSIERARTMADGLTVTSPGEYTFALIRSCVAGLVQVEEESIRSAVCHYLLRERLVVEPAGAVPLAAVLEGKVPSDETVLVASGGNASPQVLLQCLQVDLNSIK